MVSELSLCPACGGTFATRIPYPNQGSRRFTLHFTEIALCRDCNLGMALPAYSQAELDAFYSGGTYWNEAVGRSRPQVLHERNQCRHRVRHALHALGGRSGLRVLDIGAGHGWTAYWLDQASAGTFAQFDFIEPDESCSREILARAGRFTMQRVPSLADAHAGYDLVFLNHVLEHVADPLACVQHILSLLAPDGIAYFETPHADQRFKSDVFPHTWFFTPPALSRLAVRTGASELLQEVFGRLPTSKPSDLLRRGAFRASAELGLNGLAGFFDDGVWRYAPASDGIWIRWMIAPPKIALSIDTRQRADEATDFTDVAKPSRLA